MIYRASRLSVQARRRDNNRGAVSDLSETAPRSTTVSSRDDRI
ncbi:hypothetical protein SLI_7157 [Streptomyces lividans 1326]|uniref:Uncharacterized protein n=1 Tax=Streptomyces lividans 1326 TaxID=1200984 RepID=A0A7U9E217_STRLI|nr:hypothetical protein SLI_7157 [Streptomyces lividans 1326]